MSPNTTRRRLLASAGAASAAALAGCPGLGGNELAHEVEAFNERETPHALSVRVAAADGDVLYERTFDLGANGIREATEPFTGAPSTVLLAVDDEDPVRRDWPDHRCEERGMRSAGGVDVYLLPGGDLRIEPSCDTVYAE